jgi:hypothetical protein
VPARFLASAVDGTGGGLYIESMRYLLLLVLVVAAMIGYTIYWFTLADWLERASGRWIAARQSEGYRIGDTGRSVSGFPGRLTLTVTKPAIGRDGDSSWDWHGEQLIIHLQPWDFNHLIFEVAPVNDFAWSYRGTRHQGRLETQHVLASVILSDGKIERTAADLTGVVWTGDDLDAPLRIGRLQLHERRNHGEEPARPPGSMAIAVQADALTMPPAMAGPLGPSVPTSQVAATLTNPLPQGLDGLAAWRDDGGTVTFDAIAVVWGPLDARGSGTLTLDKEMRPLGAFAAEIRGFNGTIDALVRAGLLRPNAAVTAKIALGLLATHDDDGNQVLKAPVTAQDGRLYVGPVALLRLSPLSVPGASPTPASTSPTSAPSTSPPLPSAEPVSPAPSGQPVSPPASAQNPVPAPLAQPR